MEKTALSSLWSPAVREAEDAKWAVLFYPEGFADCKVDVSAIFVTTQREPV